MKFSIVTPSFNSLPHLPLCIGSVRGQRGENAETLKAKILTGGAADNSRQVAQPPGQSNPQPATRNSQPLSVSHHIQDGGSTDGTVEWMEGNTERLKAEKLKLGWASEPGLPPQPATCNLQLSFASAKDNGMYDAINKGWERADGDIFSWLNADEQYLPGTLAKIAAFFDLHPNISAVFGNTIIIDRNGDPLAARREIPLRRPYVVNGFLYALSCTCLYRRRLWDEGLLRLDTRYRYSADADLVLRLLDSGVEFGFIDDYLALFSITGDNLSFLPAMDEESAGIKRKHGAFRSGLMRKLVLSGRYLERLLKGCYGVRRISYRYALDETPNYRKFVDVRVGTAFSYEDHRDDSHGGTETQR